MSPPIVHPLPSKRILDTTHNRINFTARPIALFLCIFRFLLNFEHPAIFHRLCRFDFLVIIHCRFNNISSPVRNERPVIFYRAICYYHERPTE